MYLFVKLICSCLLLNLYCLVTSTDLKDDVKGRFLLYDINYGEGFNLRRDVYIRISNLVRFLNKNSNWTLVLPPIGRLYHWHNPQLPPYPWKTFFDLDQLRKFINVIEFHDFLQLTKSHKLDMVYLVQQIPFPKTGWKKDIKDGAKCRYNHDYLQTPEGDFDGWFFGYDEVRASQFECLDTMMEAHDMKDYLNLPKLGHLRSIMLERAEILIHGQFSEWSQEFWTGRRSMVFAKHLRDIGDAFRSAYLNSTDAADLTPRPPGDDWRVHPWPPRPALGGPYVGVHLRRGDMSRSSPNRVPSLQGAARQIIKAAKEKGLDTVFIATDAEDGEFPGFSEMLAPLKVFRYSPTPDVFEAYGPGGVAIIDQWICAHSRIFLATSASTFSYRINEERELLGFLAGSSVGMCPMDEETCEPMTRWVPVYEKAFTIPPPTSSYSSTPPSDKHIDL